MLPLRTPPWLSVLTEQHLFEGLSKDLIENCVENGIDHAARVAQPSDKVKHPMADVLLAIAADSGH